MRKILHRHAVLALTVCIGICSVVWANTNLPLLHNAKKFLSESDQPIVEAPLSDLEQSLFADAADGRLDDYSLLDAALIASGENDTKELEQYNKRVLAWCEDLRKKGCLSASPRKQVEMIFEYLHGKILFGKYDIECTDLRQALDHGRYNCVSATVLFNCLAGELGLLCRGLETPGHALSRVFLPDGPLDVETTCPRWFHLQSDPTKQAEALEKTLGRKPTADKNKLREITPIQLMAMIYYNRGVDYLAEKRFAEAAASNSKAIRLDPHNSTARGNFLATINNWAIELGNTNYFAEAAALLRQGLVFDPHYDAFAQNYEHIHYQWSRQLCKEGNFREAADLLNKASSDMPERDYFQRAEWEVYRHWSLAMFESDRIDDAFEVFAEARRRHGPCRDEMQCELAVVIEYGKKLLSQNRHEEARRIFDRALVLQPDAAILRNNRQKIADNNK